ncbi:MAG TPA: succinylglutamate desuccinylase/aspartoacylase family protein [Patescibacteria group bacterium]|nr:succinylglutamate desuccinylase/aspartoacylase family protein [Patescibacteria group bacterium]
MTQGVTKKKGGKPGKKLAVFAGVHGDERAGVFALEKLIKNIEPEAGEVYFVYANPEAIERDVRYTEKNLNRCFLKEAGVENYEERRAKELMPILDECDALLDLHASNNKEATPFIICGEDCRDIVGIFDFDIVSFDWDDIEPGATDGYMYNQGKPGICLECGSLHQSEENADLAYVSALRFLEYFGAVKNEAGEYNKRPQRSVQVVRAVKKKTEDFGFVKDFADFKKLTPGEVFAWDGEEKYVAGEDECIIFPDSDQKIGDEVFVLGRFVR